MIKIETLTALCFCRCIQSGKKGIILNFQANNVKIINLGKKENNQTLDRITGD
jgi:hypothetical protein